MVSTMQRHAIQVLRKAGKHTQAEVAEVVGVSVGTVQRVEDEAAVRDFDDGAERRRRGIGRPAKVDDALKDWLATLVREEPTLLSVELLRRARGRGYTGGKSALYETVRLLRPKKVRPLVRFEGLPGEFSQHDFGQVVVRYDDGRTERVHFFATRLKYSRWAEVSLVADERVESLVRAWVEHFARIDGIPLVAVFDRPKTVALSWRRDGKVVDWNSTFSAVVMELGIGVEVCWPRRPQEKGSVENLVGWVKGSFFKQRRFVDREDLARQLSEWLREVNHERPSRATGVVPKLRLEEERPRLRALRVRPQELALRLPIVVGPTGMVMHDGHPYSMPPEAIGLPGTLYLHAERVRIVAGRFESTHNRCRKPGEHSILPEHRAQHLSAVSGKRARRYLQREQLLALGSVTERLLTEIVHRRERSWYLDVERLHALLLRHGDGPLRDAMTRALEAQTFGAEYVAHFLGERDSGPKQAELSS
jgi:transposase